MRKKKEKKKMIGLPQKPSVNKLKMKLRSLIVRPFNCLPQQ